jgi:ADP-ribosyl-[dinitrogen reductase] hydrolase
MVRQIPLRWVGRYIVLLEMAIGDSFGCAFEFVERPYPNGLVNDTATYQDHPELPLGGGRYTDDTQMSVAVTEVIVERPGDFTRIDLAERFVYAFKRDPRPGYGKRFYEILNKVGDGLEMLEVVVPNSTRSGGAMRASPIGLFGDIETVLTLAALQASVTHNSPEGIMSAQAIAAMVHFFAYRLGTQGELGEYLERVVPGHAWGEDWTDWASVQGIPCAHAAITAVRLGTSQRDILFRSVAVGGDVDTVAAMAMFSSSLIHTLPKDLPASLYEGLERGSYGYEYLVNRDIELRQLAETFGAPALEDWKCQPN